MHELDTDNNNTDNDGLEITPREDDHGNKPYSVNSQNSVSH